MTNIEKPKFHILEVSGNNYLFWCLDMEMHLQWQDLTNTIKEDGTSNAKDKTNAIIFIRRHLHESLQTQYLSVRDPQTLWKRLKDRYDHTKTVILPQVVKPVASHIAPAQRCQAPYIVGLPLSSLTRFKPVRPA